MVKLKTMSLIETSSGSKDYTSIVHQEVKIEMGLLERLRKMELWKYAAKNGLTVSQYLRLVVESHIETGETNSLLLQQQQMEEAYVEAGPQFLEILARCQNLPKNNVTETSLN